MEKFAQFIAAGIDSFEVVKLLARRYQRGKGLGYIAAEEKQKADQNDENYTSYRELPALTRHRGFITTKLTKNEVNGTCLDRHREC
jgi:hypothetical protein